MIPRKRLVGRKRQQKYLKELGEERAAAERKIIALARDQRLTPIDRTKLKYCSLMGGSGTPTLAGRYYLDFPFTCKDCGKKEIWTGRQQKWWHERVGGIRESIAVRCRGCRLKERARRDEARRVHLEGVERKRRERTEGK